MAEQNIKLLIEYKGTAYAGWQIQKDQRSIQGCITEAIYKTTGKNVSLIGAGRTDAGVHALGQVGNFIIDHNIEPEKYKDALNYYLENDIRIKESVVVPLEFNARRAALNKRYRYLIGTEKSALYHEYRWELLKTVNFEILEEAAKLVLGEHDFSPFCVLSSRKPDNTCIITECSWKKDDNQYVIDVVGNRFLHNMVRIMVGAMVNIATIHKDQHPDNLTLEKFADILQAPTEQRIVFIAPPQGLYLVTVNY